MFNVFFCKQKTAYEVRISDWSSDVCSPDLYNDGVTLDSVIDWMTEARYPLEHEPDYARATSTEPTGGSACLQSTPQIARSQGIDSSAFVAAVSRLPMQHVPHIGGALVDKYLQGLQLLGFIQQPENSSVTAKMWTIGRAHV